MKAPPADNTPQAADAGSTDSGRMECWVYRSSRRADTYVYLGREDGFERLPAALRSALGGLELVMNLQLHAGRRLANADVIRVMRDLDSQGFYLQLPPGRMPFDGPSAARH